MITTTGNKKRQPATVDTFLTYLKDYFTQDTAKPKSTVANEAGISRMYLHNLIEGKNTDPSLDVAIRLAEAMETTLENILKDSVACT